MELIQNRDELQVTSVYSSGYKYVHVVQKVTTLATSIIDDSITSSVSNYTLTSDNYYIISEIQLLNVAIPGYYYILNDIIYSPTGVPMTVEELMLVDPSGTNIAREDVNWLSYYFIEKYYLDLISAKFAKDICGCDCSDRDYQQNKIIIDTITMGLAVINDLVKYEQFYEAERMLEQLSVCTGVVNLNCNCYA